MTALLALQLRLALPVASVTPIGIDQANLLLVKWEHRLGPCNRPFGSEAYALELDGRAVAVAVSASTVSKTVAGFYRQQVVELARICAAPSDRWATRAMLRLWREVCARRWAYWPVDAAVSYSKNADHPGDIYRFDGWEKVRTDAGSSGGGTYSRPRYATDAVYGKKTLWVWRYEVAR